MKRGVANMMTYFYKKNISFVRLLGLAFVFQLILCSQLFAEECVYNENIFNNKYFTSNTN